MMRGLGESLTLPISFKVGVAVAVPAARANTGVVQTAEEAVVPAEKSFLVPGTRIVENEPIDLYAVLFGSCGSETWDTAGAEQPKICRPGPWGTRPLESAGKLKRQVPARRIHASPC